MFQRLCEAKIGAIQTKSYQIYLRGNGTATWPSFALTHLDPVQSTLSFHGCWGQGAPICSQSNVLYRRHIPEPEDACQSHPRLFGCPAGTLWKGTWPASARWSDLCCALCKKFRVGASGGTSSSFFWTAASSHERWEPVIIWNLRSAATAQMPCEKQRLSSVAFRNFLIRCACAPWPVSKSIAPRKVDYVRIVQMHNISWEDTGVKCIQHVHAVSPWSKAPAEKSVLERAFGARLTWLLWDVVGPTSFFCHPQGDKVRKAHWYVSSLPLCSQIYGLFMDIHGENHFPIVIHCSVFPCDGCSVVPVLVPVETFQRGGKRKTNFVGRVMIEIQLYSDIFWCIVWVEHWDPFSDETWH